MRRILLMVARYFYIAPYWFYKVCLYGKSDKYSEEERFGLLKFITKKANKGGRIKIESYGSEHLPKENGFVLFPNHQGLYDVLAFLDSMPRPFSVVIKKEAADIIFLKQIRRCLRGLKIDREDLKQSMKVILQMAKEVSEGRNYLIFAEGTRTKNKNETLTFKGGSFKCAVKAKCPIVPAAIIDSYKAFDTKSIKPLTVKLFYLEPLYYEDYKDMKTNEIAAEVKKRIDEAIKAGE